MSRLITVLTIVTLIFALSITGIGYAKQTKQEIDSLVEIALLQCIDKDANELMKTAKKMSVFFENRHFLSFFVRHDEIEKVNTDLLSLQSYIEVNAFDAAYANLNHIKFMANHIYSKELPSMENLF